MSFQGSEQTGAESLHFGRGGGVGFSARHDLAAFALARERAEFSTEHGLHRLDRPARFVLRESGLKASAGFSSPHEEQA